MFSFKTNNWSIINVKLLTPCSNSICFISNKNMIILGGVTDKGLTNDVIILSSNKDFEDLTINNEQKIRFTDI